MSVLHSKIWAIKGILEFNIPEDQESFDVACKASALKYSIDEIFNEVFRKRLKYGFSEEDEKLSNVDLLEKIRDEVWEIIESKACLNFSNSDRR